MLAVYDGRRKSRWKWRSTFDGDLAYEAFVTTKKRRWDVWKGGDEYRCNG